jgi:hypothetical protein
MEQASYWLIALAILGLVIWAVARDQQRMRSRTPEQFEADVANNRDSLMRAGLLDLDRFVDPSRTKRAAIEYLKDEEQGQTKTGGKSDDPVRTDAHPPSVN